METGERARPQAQRRTLENEAYAADRKLGYSSGAPPYYDDDYERNGGDGYSYYDDDYTRGGESYYSEDYSRGGESYYTEEVSYASRGGRGRGGRGRSRRDY